MFRVLSILLNIRVSVLARCSFQKCSELYPSQVHADLELTAPSEAKISYLLALEWGVLPLLLAPWGAVVGQAKDLSFKYSSYPGKVWCTSLFCYQCQMWQALIFTDCFYSASVNCRQIVSFQYFGLSESSWRLCRKGSRLQVTTQIATSVILAPVTALHFHTHVLMGFLILLCNLLCFPKVSGTIQFLLM